MASTPDALSVIEIASAPGKARFLARGYVEHQVEGTSPWQVLPESLGNALSSPRPVSFSPVLQASMSLLEFNSFRSAGSETERLIVQGVEDREGCF